MLSSTFKELEDKRIKQVQFELNFIFYLHWRIIIYVYVSYLSMVIQREQQRNSFIN